MRRVRLRWCHDHLLLHRDGCPLCAAHLSVGGGWAYALRARTSIPTHQVRVTPSDWRTRLERRWQAVHPARTYWLAYASVWDELPEPFTYRIHAEAHGDLDAHRQHLAFNRLPAYKQAEAARALAAEAEAAREAVAA